MAKNEIRAAYNRMAREYDRWSKTVRSPERQKYTAILRSYVPKDGKVLDVGCGSGTLHRDLSAHCEVIGLDLSESQIEKGWR